MARKGDGTKPEYTTLDNPSIEYDSATNVGFIWVEGLYDIQFDVTEFRINNSAIHIKGVIKGSPANGSVECFVSN